MAFPFIKSKSKRNVKMVFPFYDAPNTATIICCHVMSEEAPILFASHDEDDGMWQFLCGESHNDDAARLVALEEVFEIDNSIGELKDMPYGCYATRKSRESSWIIRKKS